MHVLKSEGNQRVAGSRAHEQRPAQNRPTAGTGGLGVAGAARWRALLFAGAPARHQQLRRAEHAPSQRAVVADYIRVLIPLRMYSGFTLHSANLDTNRGLRW